MKNTCSWSFPAPDNTQNIFEHLLHCTVVANAVVKDSAACYDDHSPAETSPKEASNAGALLLPDPTLELRSTCEARVCMLQAVRIWSGMSCNRLPDRSLALP